MRRRADAAIALSERGSQAASVGWRIATGLRAIGRSVGFFRPSTSARPTRAWAGVTRREPEAGQPRRQHRHRQQQPPQAAQPRVLRASCRRRTPLRGPPISKIASSRPGRSIAASRYATTSSIAMGCVGVVTHRGQTIIGSRSTSARIISNDRLPAPMTIDARNSTTGTPPARRSAPVSARLLRCAGQRGGLVRQPAQVDDAPHAGARGGPTEVGRGASVQLGEAGPRRHRVHQVVGALHARRAPRRATPRRGSRPARPPSSVARSGDAAGLPREARTGSAAFLDARRRRPPMYPVAPVSRICSMGASSCPSAA